MSDWKKRNEDWRDEDELEEEEECECRQRRMSASSPTLRNAPPISTVPTPSGARIILESPVPQKKFSQFLLKNAGKYGLTFSKHIEGKFAFVKRSAAMKAPVGLLSNKAVLRKQDGGESPRQA